MPVAMGLMLTPRSSAFDHVSGDVFRSGQRTFGFSLRAILQSYLRRPEMQNGDLYHTPGMSR